MNSSTGNRLKPLKADPLEAIGLPSKGDDSLNSNEAQEAYFEIVKKRFEAHNHGPEYLSRTQQEQSSTSRLPQSFDDLSLTSSVKDDSHQAIIVAAMRKLRESFIATNRHDEFTRQAYLFIIRSTIAMNHFEAYHPALTYLVNNAAALSMFTKEETTELVRYAILDVASRQNAMRQAWEMGWSHGIFSSSGNKTQTDMEHNLELKQSLASAVRNDALSFYRCKGKLSMNEQILIRPLEQRLATHIASSLSRAYFSAEISFVEKALALRWSSDQPKAERGICQATQMWQTEESKVVFRRRRQR